VTAEMEATIQGEIDQLREEDSNVTGQFLGFLLRLAESVIPGFAGRVSREVSLMSEALYGLFSSTTNSTGSLTQAPENLPATNSTHATTILANNNSTATTILNNQVEMQTANITNANITNSVGNSETLTLFPLFTLDNGILPLLHAMCSTLTAGILSYLNSPLTLIRHAICAILASVLLLLSYPCLQRRIPQTSTLGRFLACMMCFPQMLINCLSGFCARFGRDLWFTQRLRSLSKNQTESNGWSTESNGWTGSGKNGKSGRSSTRHSHSRKSKKHGKNSRNVNDPRNAGNGNQNYSDTSASDDAEENSDSYSDSDMNNAKNVNAKNVAKLRRTESGEQPGGRGRLNSRGSDILDDLDEADGDIVQGRIVGHVNKGEPSATSRKNLASGKIYHTEATKSNSAYSRVSNHVKFLWDMSLGAVLRCLWWMLGSSENDAGTPGSKTSSRISTLRSGEAPQHNPIGALLSLIYSRLVLHILRPLVLESSRTRTLGAALTAAGSAAVSGREGSEAADGDAVSDAVTNNTHAASDNTNSTSFFHLLLLEMRFCVAAIEVIVALMIYLVVNVICLALSWVWLPICAGMDLISLFFWAIEEIMPCNCWGKYSRSSNSSGTQNNNRNSNSHISNSTYDKENTNSNTYTNNSSSGTINADWFEGDSSARTCPPTDWKARCLYTPFLRARSASLSMLQAHVEHVVTLLKAIVLESLGTKRARERATRERRERARERRKKWASENRNVVRNTMSEISPTGKPDTPHINTPKIEMQTSKPSGKVPSTGKGSGENLKGKYQQSPHSTPEIDDPDDPERTPTSPFRPPSRDASRASSKETVVQSESKDQSKTQSKKSSKKGWKGGSGQKGKGAGGSKAKGDDDELLLLQGGSTFSWNLKGVSLLVRQLSASLRRFVGRVRRFCRFGKDGSGVTSVNPADKSSANTHNTHTPTTPSGFRTNRGTGNSVDDYSSDSDDESTHANGVYGLYASDARTEELTNRYNELVRLCVRWSNQTSSIYEYAAEVQSPSDAQNSDVSNDGSSDRGSDGANDQRNTGEESCGSGYTNALLKRRCFAVDGSDYSSLLLGRSPANNLNTANKQRSEHTTQNIAHSSGSASSALGDLTILKKIDEDKTAIFPGTDRSTDLGTVVSDKTVTDSTDPTKPDPLGGSRSSTASSSPSRLSRLSLVSPPPSKVVLGAGKSPKQWRQEMKMVDTLLDVGKASWMDKLWNLFSDVMEGRALQLNSQFFNSEANRKDAKLKDANSNTALSGSSGTDTPGGSSSSVNLIPGSQQAAERRKKALERKKLSHTKNKRVFFSRGNLSFLVNSIVFYVKVLGRDAWKCALHGPTRMVWLVVALGSIFFRSVFSLVN
jgi:hypothetical protein